MKEATIEPETLHAAELRAVEERRAQRLAEARAHAAMQARLRKRSLACGSLRLILFAVLVLVAVRVWRSHGDPASSVAMAVSFLGFWGLVAYHGRVQRAEERARRRRVLAEESAARLAGRTGPGVEAPLVRDPVSDLEAGLAVYRLEDASHAIPEWALDDLGIEGAPPSLYALLDTTQSMFGARRLRLMLRHPVVDVQAIHARQDCVRELAGETALHDALRLAYFEWRGARLARVPSFLTLGRVLPRGAFRVAVLACGLITVPAIVLAVLVHALAPLALLATSACLAFNFVARRRGPVLRDAYLELEPVVRVALEIAPLLRARPPRSTLLAAQTTLFDEFTKRDSPYQLQRVSRCMRLLHLHETGFPYMVLQFLTLWDLQCLLVLEDAMRREHGFDRLVGALGDLEALLALATFAAEQPCVRFPEVVAAEAPHCEIESGEHPLLRCGRAVPNDLRLGGEARLVLITGSNMAGKSTFLRMVALNVVLAQTGAPVRAAAMRITPLFLYANINVRDSLADGKSYFLVEVERVQKILAAASTNRFVLAIFDELFRGTNSTERLAASREIARHLAASGGLFLLATHDQELARLATEEQVPGIMTLHFRDEIVDGAMSFPYRAHAGVARTHNALRLMELNGYPPDLVQRAQHFAEERSQKN